MTHHFRCTGCGYGCDNKHHVHANCRPIPTDSYEGIAREDHPHEGCYMKTPRKNPFAALLALLEARPEADKVLITNTLLGHLSDPNQRPCHCVFGASMPSDLCRDTAARGLHLQLDRYCCSEPYRAWLRGLGFTVPASTAAACILSMESKQDPAFFFLSQMEIENDTFDLDDERYDHHSEIAAKARFEHMAAFLRRYAERFEVWTADGEEVPW